VARPKEDTALAVAFFLSGVAALTYQVVWQRVLYTIFGTNIESIAVVVTAFLLGLGIGSAAGGVMSQRLGGRSLYGFAILELTIAAYGVGSVPLFRSVGGLAAVLAPATSAGLTFALILIPTLCMGATLPLLTGYEARRRGSVGVSVADLYFINTAGSAFAAAGAVAFTLPTFGEMRSAWAAAAVNGVVGIGVYIHARTRESVP
jgi:spermidine synthase